MNWYLKVWSLYATFTGRARRSEYWWFFLLNTLVAIGLGVLDGLSGTMTDNGIGILGLVYALAALIPGISVSVRRLHDTGRSGFWWFILLVPIIGMIVMLVFMFLDSEDGANKYGENPKANDETLAIEA